MSALGLRGHIPRNERFTAQTAVSADASRVHHSSPQPCSHLQIRNEETAGGNGIRIYWRVEDFTDNERYFTIDAASEYEGPAEAKEFWARSVGGDADLVAIFYLRRG
jgi:hypothetical protein